MSKHKMLWAVLWLGCSLLAAVWQFIEICASSALRNAEPAHFAVGYFELLALGCLARLLYLLFWLKEE
jgi:Na+-driven multidrug efflux pump